MPSDWNLSDLCPVLIKGYPTICANYRGISLLAIAYKVLTSILCQRLKPYAKALIGPLSVWLQTWQVHHRKDIHTTPNPGKRHENKSKHITFLLTSRQLSMASKGSRIYRNV